MSSILLGAVKENGPRKLGPYAVLLALADYADADGYSFPGVAKIAHEARCSERAARMHLDALEAEGWITRRRRRRSDGLLGTYEYWIDREKLGVPVKRRSSPPPAKSAGSQRQNLPRARPAAKSAAHNSQILKGRTVDPSPSCVDLTAFELSSLMAGRSFVQSSTGDLIKPGSPAAARLRASACSVGTAGPGSDGPLSVGL